MNEDRTIHKTIQNSKNGNPNTYGSTRLAHGNNTHIKKGTINNN